MNKMIDTIKEIHEDFVCLFKMGAFYHAYNRDAYILAYLSGYKVRKIERDVKECGFPVSNISKIMARLEEKQINYILIDKRNNYDVDQKTDYKNLNKYQKYYEKAKYYINNKTRVEKINDYLLRNLEEKDINKTIWRIEEILYERRKV